MLYIDLGRPGLLQSCRADDDDDVYRFTACNIFIYGLSRTFCLVEIT
jgi:hypothetical protein